MPIKPENRHHYRGKAWDDARAAVLARAGNACECRGECGEQHRTNVCAAPNGATIHRERSAPWRWIRGPFETRGTPLLPGVRVVLTVAHLDHNPGVNDVERLRAFCQRCHLRHDRFLHAANARATLAAKREAAVRDAGQGALPIGGGQ